MRERERERGGGGDIERTRQIDICIDRHTLIGGGREEQIHGYRWWENRLTDKHTVLGDKEEVDEIKER